MLSTEDVRPGPLRDFYQGFPRMASSFGPRGHRVFAAGARFQGHAAVFFWNEAHESDFTRPAVSTRSERC
jgi:hypothetical protein